MPGEPSSRNVIIAFVVVVLALAAGAALILSSRPDPVNITINPPVPTASPEPSAPPGPIRVYVTGAVANPGLTLELPSGSRVEDALEAAGGVTDEADMARINPVDFLQDGDHVHVFSVNETDEPAIATPSGSGLVNINTATLDELVALPGIGETTAQAIIDYREANGPFTSIEQLDAVEGIGEATLNELAELITVGD
jgi:competence protein ComEA